jgi:hypothetical protein
MKNRDLSRLFVTDLIRPRAIRGVFVAKPAPLALLTDPAISVAASACPGHHGDGRVPSR